MNQVRDITVPVAEVTQAAKAAEAGGPTKDARLARAISEFVRAEFKAPVDVVASFIDLLIEDTANAAYEVYRADLATMKAASTTLSQTVDALLDAAASQQTLADRDLDVIAAEIRHTLRTPITAIMGYGELLLEEAREDGETNLLGTLNDMLSATRRLLASLDDMVEFIQAVPHGGGSDELKQPSGGSSLVEHALSTLRAVLASEPTEERRVTGHILVVDDNPSSVDLLSHRLERDGHVIHSCTDGDAALEALGKLDFDLALVDLLMPGTNGIDVLRSIRSTPHTADMPVVMMSGVSASDGAVRSIDLGADDFLIKPLDPTLMRARLSALLERKFLRDREQARLTQLRQERERSERLLLNMLPRPIVERLRNGERIIADQHAAATILFCDLVGFTSLASRLTPQQTIDLLNAVFSRLDHLTGEAGLEKIKTIGDAYMVAGGLPSPRPDHVAAVVDMALRIPAVVADASRAFGESLSVRLGIHTGPVTAGIIGNDRFAYDVWGDTVNVASRMERTGVPGRVHVTEDVRRALGRRYRAEALPPMDIKGKGLMSTYLLS